MSRAFRDQLIAASLKQASAVAVRLAGATFRDQLIAASLKPADARDTRSRMYAPFRDQLIAASLKPHEAAGLAATDTAFPRSIDRGLIEACR